MIDPNQLRQLGWSEDLIKEVTRIADEINTTATEGLEIEQLDILESSCSGSSIYFTDHVINTSIDIRVPDEKE